MSEYDEFDEIEIENEDLLDQISSSIDASEVETFEDSSHGISRPVNARRRIEEYFEMRELEEQVTDPDFDIYIADEEVGFNIELDSGTYDGNSY